MNKLANWGIVAITALFAVCSLPVAGRVMEGVDGNIKWSIDPETMTLTISGNGPMNDYRPKQDMSMGLEDDYISTAPWYDSADLYWGGPTEGIRHVIVEDGVTSIGDFAFHDLRHVESVRLPSDIERLGKYSFSYCRAPITIPNGITKIEECSFAHSRSDILVIPDGVTDIGDGAFLQFSGEVVIPPAVKHIGKRAFIATHMTSLSIPEGIKIDSLAFDNFECKSELMISNNCEIADHAFRYAIIKKLVMSENCSISEHGFENAKVEELVTPVDMPLRYIRHTASLQNAELRSGGEELNDSLFFGCSSLKSVVIDDGILRIGKYAFAGCENLSSVKNSGSVREIDDYAFQNCVRLKSLSNTGSLNRIGSYAFNGCEILESVGNTDNLDEIGNYAFYCCYSLSDFSFGENLSGIGDYAFAYCSALKMPALHLNGLRSLGEYAFKSCEGLEEVHLGNAITNIPAGVFGQCSNLAKVTLPELVDTISSHAFWLCKSLVSFEIPSTVRYIGTYAFYISNLSDGTLKIPDGISVIEPYSFGECKMPSVSIPESVREIGKGAFMGCTFDRIELPESVEVIDVKAFAYNRVLRSAVLPSSLVRIGQECFNGCENLDTVYNWSRTPQNIDEYAFSKYGVLVVPEVNADAYRAISPWNRFTIIGDATPVRSVRTDEELYPVYDVLGRPVAHPVSGIYIRKGRKVFFP